ncbi:uncharacterized protein LOC103983626 [Musa acuminata AAA Group]|uniref:uncharacterized protein LOC103983626 n=1 Tax=Musa acuminata AAA Group TaxID=214697 RepID=UPI0031D4C331
MSRDPAKTVYIGNLDEKVSERVLYEILIQVGRVVDLYIPRDKETNRHKGYAFAEYESEEIADYAVRLFSGLVRLHNKTLKFAISGQDKSSQNTRTPMTPKPNSPPILKPTSVHTREIATSNGLVSQGVGSGNYEYTRRVFGAMLNNVNRWGGTHPNAYPSY